MNNRRSSLNLISVALPAGVLTAVLFAAGPSRAQSVPLACTMKYGPADQQSYSITPACPSSKYVAGGGFESASGWSEDFRGGNPATQFRAQGYLVQAEAVCCNIAPWLESATGSGSALATCSSGIAVGGGATCQQGAELVISEPSPAQSGAVPTGWYAQCSTGTAKAWVNCAQTQMPWSADLSSCRVQTDVEQYGARVFCPQGQIAIAAGSWCPRSSILSSWVQGLDPRQTITLCDDGDISVASAICCNGTRN